MLAIIIIVVACAPAAQRALVRTSSAFSGMITKLVGLVTITFHFSFFCVLTVAFSSGTLSEIEFAFRQSPRIFHPIRLTQDVVLRYDWLQTSKPRLLVEFGQFREPNCTPRTGENGEWGGE